VDGPCVRCLEKSWALNTKTQGKEWGSLAAAGLPVGGGAHAILNAASRILYLQYWATGGRQATLERIDVGVERKRWRTISGSYAKSWSLLGVLEI